MRVTDSITYLRTGRSVRATGSIVDRYRNGSVKVMPARDDWNHIIVTPAEIDAGREKPPIAPREKLAAAPDDLKPPRKARAPKPPPLPRWKQLVNIVRAANDDSRLFPGITMNMVVELADELEAAQSLFQTKP